MDRKPRRPGLLERDSGGPDLPADAPWQDCPGLELVGDGGTENGESQGYPGLW